jgi:hypothetical protein
MGGRNVPGNPVMSRGQPGAVRRGGPCREVHLGTALTGPATGCVDWHTACHLSLGSLYARTGQRQQARPELSAAIELYRAMEMTFWLPQTEVTLAQVEAQ